MRKQIILIMVIALAIVILPDICLYSEEEMTPEKVIERMIKAIKEKNDPMRNRMYFKLRIMEGKSVDPLLKAYNENNDQDVKEYIIFTLGWIFDERVIPHLIKFLDEKEAGCRATAARALGNQESEKATPALIKVLEDKVPEVRRDAASALGLIGDPKALPHLRKLLSDENELVRFFTKEAIDNIEWELKFGKHKSKNTEKLIH
ncbi:HEAT repeat domain-containing protein [bacterium]|nr:HEAT repeat domain-containing protein [bacterium]